MQFLKDVSVLVLGLGESGVACAQFAHRCGAQVTVADTRAMPPGLAAVQALQGVSIHLGAFNTVSHDVLLNGMTVMVVSPGLSPHAEYNPDVAALLAAATLRGIAIRSEVDWFMQALADLSINLSINPPYTPKVLAITGTNGKTTVTELTAHVCNEAGVTATACGNISPAMLTALMAAQDTQTYPDVWVLELSSFQLHTTHAFNPTAAALLNLSQDHLDWHLNMDEYATDKAKVWGEQSTVILNRDDAAVMALRGKAHRVLTFGLDEPSALGDLGCMVEGSLNWLCIASEVEPEKKRRKTDPVVTQPQRLMPADALRLRGSHNHANAQAALLLAQAAGVPLAKALHGLRTYEGAANRCELVQIVADVEYINDSKGTNVGATVAALNGLSEGRSRLILIAGGVGKGQDFSPLATPVAQSCKAVVLLGEAKDDIANALVSTGIALHRAASMDEAVQCAARLAKTGDAVLLSPACASFDMYKNYAHRAQAFVQAVEQLALDACMGQSAQEGQL